MNCVYANPAGGDGGGGDGGDEVAIDDYVGNNEVNPDQVPLIDEFDREGKTKEEIDTLLAYAEGEFFKTPEQVEESREEKEKADKEKADKEKKGGDKGDDDSKAEEDKDAKGDKDKDGKKKDNKVEDVDGEANASEEFLKEVSLDKEAFNALPEKTQEILVDKVMGKNESSEKNIELNMKIDGLNGQISTMLGDTVHAARLEEIRTGKSIVAKAGNFINDAFMVKLDTLIGEDNGMKKAQDLLKAEVDKQITTERGVAEGQRVTRQLEKDVWKNLLKLGKIDKRLELEETNHTKIDAKHPEWDKFQKGTNEILKYATARGITNQQLSKMKPKELYAAFAAHAGWDKDKQKTTFKAGRESLLKNLRNPKLAGAKSLKQDKQIAQGSGLTGGSVDRATLKAELLEDDTTNWEMLMDRAEGNPAEISELNELLQEAREEKHRAA